MSIFKAAISERVWESKYRYQYEGKILDTDMEATWRRVAKAIAKAEKSPERKTWEAAFYQILEGFQFLPGGRILAGAGTKHRVTLLNCFVMDIASDSLAGIFEALSEGALTLQQGGGIGYDFSVLRPAHDLVKKTGTYASGPVSFMRIWDTMCSVLLSTGARRGAMMAVLRCDHPDIEAFIAAKKDARELRHFNVSVMVSDAFMQAVKNDESWPLIFPVDDIHSGDEIIYRQCRVYKRVRARALWEAIIASAYDYAEPGVLFGDTINRMNNLWYRERINATNPCGEIPLPAYGACDLGSLNLTTFVEGAFTNQARLNWQRLTETTRIATRFLDNVIDVSQYPLAVQKKMSQGTRRIGLGITGLANVFVMLNMPYGSPESIQLATDIMRLIANNTWETSIELAKEKGPFPFYTQEYLQGQFLASLDNELRQAIAKNGIRNSHHNTVAPTGTISLLANNVSNGIEPIFSAAYDRHVRETEAETHTFSVKDYAYQLWQEKENTTALPPAWIETKDLHPLAHLQVQAAIQPYIDNAISKTINIPRDFPFKELSHIYTQAYTLGLKGCTIFRPNPITGSILEIPEEHCCQYE